MFIDDAKGKSTKLNAVAKSATVSQQVRPPNVFKPIHFNVYCNLGKAGLSSILR